MVNVLLVGIGGFLGSVLRYLVSGLLQDWTKVETFPLGTLVVNVLGCLVIGFFSQLAEARGAFSPETRAFVVIGILGGFTTFSTFGNESLNLLRDAEHWFAFLNIAGHIVLGLGAVFLGRVIGHEIWR